jgi:hypothetical protein
MFALVCLTLAAFGSLGLTLVGVVQSFSGTARGRYFACCGLLGMCGRSREAASPQRLAMRAVIRRIVRIGR